MSNRALGLSIFALSLLSFPAFGQPSSTSPFLPNRYTLILNDPPVAARFNTRAAIATPQADTYRAQILSAQAQVKANLASRNIQVTGSVTEVLNAVFVVAPAARLSELQSIPGVASVAPVRKMRINLNRATSLANAPAAWNAVGGQSNAGAGIKIGIIDTGVDQTHPALQDSSLQMPAGFPKGVTAYTTNKVIVARSYVNLLAAGSSASNPAADSAPDDLTPRDRIGHGTFNAVVAAGNSTTTPAAASTGGNIVIAGMAPKAWIGNYKVSGSPGVDEFATDQTLIAAVNDAVADGMDVISCSIGGLAYTSAANDPVATAFENATKSAVVVASSGDDGTTSYDDNFQYPGFNSISSPSNAPDVISVGATINSHVMLPTVSVNASSAPSSLKGITAAYGDSYFYPADFGASQAPLIDVTTLGNDGTACSALPANSLSNAYALILRGNCTFEVKATNAQNAGAVGVIFYMADSSAPINPESTDQNTGFQFFGPTVMISNSSGLAVKSYLASNPGAMVTIDLNGIEQDVTTFSQLPCTNSLGPCSAYSPAVTANMFASYSSMGPTPDGLLKPDIVAPGGFDYALGTDYNDYYLPAPGGMYSATQNYDPNQPYGVNVFSSTRYAAGQGTSFSAPLTAGAAALLKQAHPNLQPTQIKSMLVNYSAQDTTADDFGDPVDAEWIGAGRLDANAAMNGGITAVPSTISFGIVNSATFPIQKSVTLTNTTSSSVTLNVSVSCCSVNAVPGNLPNATVTAGQSGQGSVTIPAGGTAALPVTFSGPAPAPCTATNTSACGEYSGTVVLKNSNSTLHIPFMLLEGSNTVDNLLPLGGGEGVPGEDVGPAAVQLTDAYGIPVSGSSVTYSVSPRGSLTLSSASGEPACSPASSTTSLTCPTDQYGYSYVEVVNGSGVASPTLSFTASGSTGSFSYNIQAAPVTANNAVVDATSFAKQPVAPGSYVNIYGTGLSNYTDTDSATTDALSADGTYDILPLQLDYVTVTFDVPSANISVPGRITYVSPTVVQIQVPWELQGQSSAQMKVVLNGDLLGNVVTVPLNNYAPQFFTNGNNIADALDQSYNLITTSHPATRGQLVQLYANGLGPVNNQPGSGAPATDASSTTKQQVTVNFGGQTATASFAGLAPGFPGLYQINVTVPSNAQTGSAVPVTISVNGVTSGQATLPIQ